MSSLVAITVLRLHLTQRVKLRLHLTQRVKLKWHLTQRVKLRVKVKRKAQRPKSLIQIHVFMSRAYLSRPFSLQAISYSMMKD